MNKRSNFNRRNGKKISISSADFNRMTVMKIIKTNIAATKEVREQDDFDVKISDELDRLD